MTSYLRRLLRTGAAYQLADAVSKVVALALLPVYTRHLTRADYGTAELL
jgi:O-antigen/teichoic acid export membrane protein